MFTIGLARGDQRIAKNLFIGIDGNAYMAYNYVYLNIFIDIYMHMISFFWHTREQTGHPREKDNVMEKPVADSADSTISYIYINHLDIMKNHAYICRNDTGRPHKLE